jgi:two-component sensor histidine kinase
LHYRASGEKQRIVVFTKRIPCADRELGSLRSELDAWLAAERVPPDAAFEVKLVAHEAAVNAIKHAQPGGYVVVTAEVEDGEVVVEVADPEADAWAEVPSTEDGLTGLQLINGFTTRVKAIPLRRGAALVMEVDNG